jgi:hypothetical protein
MLPSQNCLVLLLKEPWFFFTLPFCSFALQTVQASNSPTIQRVRLQLLLQLRAANDDDDSANSQRNGSLSGQYKGKRRTPIRRVAANAVAKKLRKSMYFTVWNFDLVLDSGLIELLRVAYICQRE